jgi:5-methylcytosine-specific restriction endonuclease McrA
MASPKSKAWDKTDGFCWYCGIELHPFGNFCIDHALPKDRGGTNAAENLLPSCRRCNSRKGKRTVEEFRDQLTRNTVPKFTEEQLRYLTEIGVQLPEQWPAPPVHVFWAERQAQGN